MNPLQELYQELIIDHTRAPRNVGKIEHPTHHAEGFNPLCGDQLTLSLLVDDQDIIQQVKFVGSGCSISTASASLMTEVLIGKSIQEAERLFIDFHQLLTSDRSVDEARLNKLMVFAGVKAYPSRVKCATLAWHTLQAALQKKQEKISTE